MYQFLFNFFAPFRKYRFKGGFFKQLYIKITDIKSINHTVIMLLFYVNF